MSSEDVFLAWDDHNSTLVGVFGKLLENSTLVDCTIAAEGQYLKAHKVVLSACSPYFELLFTQENEKNPIVVLKDIKFEELKSMIDFVYCGKVRIPEDRLENFIAAAESLQIKGLGGDWKENVSNKKELKSLPVHKGEGCASPIRRKRVKRSCSRGSEENTSALSSVLDINHESDSCENFLQNEESIDEPVTFSKTKASSSVAKHGATIQEELGSVRTDLSTSDIQHMRTSLPLAKTQPLLPSTETVAKREPEPIAEIFLPEIDCFIEPKIEVCVEESPLLDEGTSMMITSDVYQHSRQNYNAFSGAASAAAGAEPPVLPPHGRSQGAMAMAAASAWAGAPCLPARHDRPFACQQCGKTFMRKQHLQSHQSMHSGQRPFACHLCDKAFAHKNKLREHLRVHTGERPYQCTHCLYASAISSNLLKHMRSVHRHAMDASQLR